MLIPFQNVCNCVCVRARVIMLTWVDTHFIIHSCCVVILLDFYLKMHQIDAIKYEIFKHFFLLERPPIPPRPLYRLHIILTFFTPDTFSRLVSLWLSLLRCKMIGDCFQWCCFQDAGISQVGFLLGSCGVGLALTSEICLKGLPKTPTGEIMQYKG